MASQTATVTAEPRSQLGSRANKRLRDSGKLPGVIYGHKQSVVPITLPGKEDVKHLDHGTHLFALTVAGGQSENVLVKDVQYDYLGTTVIHVDFARVDLTERVEVTVPIELKGDPKGEADGGVLTQVMGELEIECVVTDIPDVIRHNVAGMALDDVVHIRDLVLPPGAKALQDGDQIVATVKTVTDQEAVESEENEPEVIGGKPEDVPAAE